ncbi:hypothetical protein CGLAU_08885 [Corynebacterium glaucum]|uniref:Uncharacterized protein n=1 Tax=Corynebacterium glaucum TaxID=187491 RepID=A0A1Q2HY07_9CORY|nr:hypothetical protein [Corynebacterium glaucum]AQQ15731.1 hypothetical protein CGLAU_08885 [Corynebacterium glaucum]WJZ08234.1 hypothetical protein CGLAUT_08770 [Corynebacterium glaucum]
MHPGSVPTDADIALVESSLETFARVGITLNDDIEAEDVEDAVADDLATFRSYPLTTVAGLHDPDGAPFLNGAVVSSVEVEAGVISAEDIVAIVERFAGAAGSEATDVAVMPDPETDGATGSVRVRFGEWDVTDINYDFLPTDGDGADANGTDAGTASRTFELDVIAAALPVDAAAATFPTPDGRDVTLFIPAGAGSDVAEALFAAIEAEFEIQ